MEDREAADPHIERLARAMDRVRAASARASQAQEHLAHARRTLRESQATAAPGQVMPIERGEQRGDSS